MHKLFFKDIVREKDGFLRGPFGGALKKEIFIPKGDETYKVYEQGVVLNRDESIGTYYISKGYFDSAMYRFEVKEKDFLVSCSGVNYGAIYQLRKGAEKGIINQALLRIRLNNKLVSDSFFKYYFETFIVKKITGGTGDSTIPNFPPMNVVKSIEIEIPDLPIQQKIAAVLSALDDKIELNNKINRELEAMAKTLYDYWFVQFDFPNEREKPYKSSGGKMVWNEALKREIPERWEAKHLPDYGEFKNGINYDPSQPGDTEAKIINVRNISSSTWFVSPYELDTITLKNNDVKNYLVTEKDILIARSGIPGATRIIFEFENNTIYCGFIIRYQVESIITKNYLFFCLKDLERSTTSKSAGTIMQNVNQDTLKRMWIVFPDGNTISKFNDFISPIFQSINKNIKENQHLSNLRDWLLPMLMNGQVSVGEAYEQVEDVLSMAAEPEVAYSKMVKLDIPKKETGFAKQVLAGKIVSLFKEDGNFTHIKFQKLQFLAEHIAEADVNLNYYFQTAGPYDNRFMHTIAHSFKKSKWFDEQKYKFIPLEKNDQIEGYYQGYFGPVSHQLKSLFDLLANATVAETEIIATLYAVWNNRILLKQTIEESLLIQDFYNWSDRKHRYSEKQIQEGLHWLKQNNFEPRGFGKEIKRPNKEAKQV